MVIAVTDITKRGIYRSSTGVINALDPVVSMVTVQLVKAVASTTQRVWFPDPIVIKGGKVIRHAAPSAPPSSTVNSNKSVGFFDGTNELTFHNMIDPEDEANGQDVNHSQSNITLIRREQTAPWTDGLQEGYAYVGKGTGYIDIQTVVNTTAGLDQWATFIVYGGDEVTNAKVFEVNLGTGTSAVAVTGIGAIPSVIFIAGVNESTAIADFDDVNPGLSALADSEFTYGFAANISGNPQGSFTSGTEHDVQPVDHTNVISNTACLVNALNGTLHYKVTADNWGSDGLDLTPSASAGSAKCGGLALTFSDDILIAVADTTYPTSGNYTQADIGFKPLIAEIIAQDGPTAYDTATQIDFSAEHIAIFDEKSVICNQANYSHGVDSWAKAAYGGGLTSLSFLECDTEAGGANASAILDTSAHTLNSSGWTFTVSTNPVVASKGRTLALG